MGAISTKLGAAALTMAALFAGDASAGTLDQIRQDKTIRIAYREDSPPFSYVVPSVPVPVGFMLDLCRGVAATLADQLKIPDLKVVYVPVTSVDRFDAITKNKADLLCEATTHTQKRRETLDFSIPTFIDGASFVIRSDGPQDIKSLAGKKVGVLVGTTTETELHRALAAVRVNAEVVLVKIHQEGVDVLEKGGVAAYFADRAILSFLLKKEKPLANLLLADTYLSIEPFALAMRRGDEDFRLAVDRALSHIYRSGAIAQIFVRSFGPKDKPSPNLQALYMIATLPE